MHMRGYRDAALNLFALLLLAAFTTIARAASDATWGLEPLMASLQQVKSASATFVERKYLQLLTQRMETSGTLSYAAPDWLQKVTHKPATETFELRGETLAGVQPDGARYSITLTDHPEIAALVEGIRSTLAGDLPTLKRYYTVDFKGERANWQLALTPKDQKVREKIDDILISGVEATLKLVEVHEKDGDRSEMIITPDDS